MKRPSLAVITRQIGASIDLLHQYNRLPARALRRFAERPAQVVIAKTLLEGKRPHLAGYEFSVAPFRSIYGSSVSGVLAIDRELHSPRPLRAFVGHRFTPPVTNNLRHNLTVDLPAVWHQLVVLGYGYAQRLRIRERHQPHPPERLLRVRRPRNRSATQRSD